MKTKYILFYTWIVVILADITSQCSAEQKILLPFYVPHPRASIGVNGTATLPPGMIPPATPNPIPGWTHPGPGYVPALGRSGLHIVIDDNWAHYKGYRNVGIEIYASTTSPTDRDLTLELGYSHDNYSGPSLSNQFTIRLPANEKYVRHNLPIYSMSESSALKEAKFSEEGREHKELALKNTYFYYGFSGRGAAPVRNVLSLSPKLKLNAADTVDPVNAAGASQQPLNNYYGTIPSVYLMSTNGAGTVGMTGLPISKLTSYSQLPTSPLPYNYYPSIAASIDDLQSLINTHPAQWSAMKEWIAQGGQLIVFNDSAKEKNSFGAIDKLFLTGGDQDEITLERNSKRWQPLKFSDGTLSDVLMNGSGFELPKAKTQRYFGEQQLGVRGQGLGCVFLLGLFDRTKTSGLSLNLSALDNYSVREVNGGVLQTVPEGTSLRIPGVGDPPVTMFQIMITAFAIVIGPVNYILLRRNKRLSWLMLTVPIGAVLVAGALFAYSMASDGFDIRVRALSVTHLDQDEQQAVTNARIAAYAGYSVGDGMKFSPTTAIDYVEDDADGRQYYRYRRNYGAAFSTQWTNRQGSADSALDAQHLRSGWISSRKMQQFNTQRAYPCKRNLKIVQQETDLKVNNRLGCKVLWIAIQDDDGKFYIASDIAEAGASSPKVAEETDVEAQSRAFADQFSLGATTSVRTNGVYTQSMTTFSNAIVDHLKNNPQKKNFVAIVEDWPDFEWGVVDPLKVKPSLHFVTGEW